MSEHWVKLDVGYFTNPKVLSVPPPARMLHLASILWTAQHLTDGYVPPTALRTLSETVPIAFRWRKHYAVALEQAGLWDPMPGEDGGWLVHDFTRHNASSTRAAVEANREATRKRVERWRRQHGEL